jgi:hypothetical protein
VGALCGIDRAAVALDSIDSMTWGIIIIIIQVGWAPLLESS